MEASLGDSIDVEEMYRRYGPMVLRRCRRLLGDEEQALDAMQDTFVRLIRYQQRLTAQAPSSLLYRMATHVCLNRIRSRKRAPATANTELLERIATDEGVEERSLSRTILDRLFGREPVSTRMIAVLHWHDGLTLAETAAEVGLSVSGVRKRLRKLQAASLGEAQ